MKALSKSSSGHKALSHDSENLRGHAPAIVSYWSLHWIHQERQDDQLKRLFEIQPILSCSGLCRRVLARMPSEFFL
jgi:hypothetical protein